MTIAFVLGNGTSRRDLDLARLAEIGTVYGCNAIHREFTPSVLVSTDVPISRHIQQSGYSANNIHYTRKPLPDLGARRIPQEYFGYSSGPVATAIASLDRHRNIYLIGFDMGPTATGNFNNMYADTEFYKKSSALPTYTGNWIRQLVKISKDFPKVRYTRVKGATSASIIELENLPNFSHVTLAEFLDRINNTKDL